MADPSLLLLVLYFRAGGSRVGLERGGGEERSDAFCGSGKFSAIKLDPWKKINMFENSAPMLKLQ